MSQCSYFVSAPTVRFLRSMEQVRLLQQADRRRLAAILYSEIKPLIGTNDHDRLQSAAAEAQDSRWRLVSMGADDCDAELRIARIKEQWLRSQLELLSPTSPVAEVLAMKRVEVIEGFIRDQLSFDAGEVVYLSNYGSSERFESDQSSRSVA
jgi:hypothetical protein